jgi:hypothetical protein
MASLTLISNGKPVWRRHSYSGAPQVVRLKVGQSLEEALEPYRKPPAGFFVSITLPSYIPMLPEGKEVFGATRLTAQGPVPDDAS